MTRAHGHRFTDACMHFHSQAAAQLLWESNARVSVDFAAGGGLAIMTAMSMNIKAIAVCLNEPHTKILQKILKKHARAHIEADNNAFVPSDKAARMEKLKSPGYLKWEKQQGASKRAAPDTLQIPLTKRAALAENIDALLESLQTGGSPAAKKQPAPKANPKAGGAQAGPAGQAGQAGGAQPAATTEGQATAAADGNNPGSSSSSSGPAAGGTGAAAAAAPTPDLAALLKQWGSSSVGSGPAYLPRPAAPTPDLTDHVGLVLAREPSCGVLLSTT